MPIEVPYYIRPSRRKVPRFNYDILGAHWSQGRRKNRQDEHLLVHARSNRSPIFMALCDGLGGHKHGDVSAQTAVKSLAENQKLILLGKNHEQIAKNLALGIHRAHFKIVEEIEKLAGNKEPPSESQQLAEKDGGTTVVAAVVKGGYAHVQNAGDSRAYLIKGNDVQQLSKDHVTNWGELYSILGFKPEPPSLHESPPIKIPYGAALVLCSDGVWRGLNNHDLAGIVGQQLTAQEMAKRLVETAERNYGYDEASALVFLNKKSRKKNKA